MDSSKWCPFLPRITHRRMHKSSISFQNQRSLDRRSSRESRHVCSQYQSWACWNIMVHSSGWRCIKIKRNNKVLVQSRYILEGRSLVQKNQLVYREWYSDNKNYSKAWRSCDNWARYSALDERIWSILTFILEYLSWMIQNVIFCYSKTTKKLRDST